jgi:hypothetical protein
MKQLCVLTTEGHQLIVRAMLNHPSMIKNVDSIGSPYRGEPVGDDQGAAARSTSCSEENSSYSARASRAAVGSSMITSGALR